MDIFKKHSKEIEAYKLAASKAAAKKRAVADEYKKLVSLSDVTDSSIVFKASDPFSLEGAPDMTKSERDRKILELKKRRATPSWMMMSTEQHTRASWRPWLRMWPRNTRPWWMLKRQPTTP